MRWLRSAPTPTARRLLSPSLSCPLAKGATNDEVLRHWIYHIESTMQYADEKSASEGGEEEGSCRGDSLSMVRNSQQMK